MAKKYLLKRCGFLMGEYSSKELKAMSLKGELHPEDEIQKKGDKSWYELGRVNGLGYERTKTNPPKEIISNEKLGIKKQRGQSDRALTSRMVQNEEKNCSEKKSRKPNNEITEHYEGGGVEIDKKSKRNTEPAVIGNASDLPTRSKKNGEESATASNEPPEEKSGCQHDYFASLERSTTSDDPNSGKHHVRQPESKHEDLAKDESELTGTENPFAILDDKEPSVSHSSTNGTTSHLFSSLKDSEDDPFASLSSDESPDLTTTGTSDDKSSINAHFEDLPHQESPHQMNDGDKYFSPLD